MVLAGLCATHRYGWKIPKIGDSVEAVERRSVDLRFILRGTIRPGNETVILAFDDKTFANDPTLFERRAGWARVIRALQQAGAKVIGSDALFTDPEQLLNPDLHHSIDNYLQSAPSAPGDDEAVRLLRRVQQETRGDLQLAETIRNTGNVVLAMHLGRSRSGKRPESDDRSLHKGRYGQTYPGPFKPKEVDEIIASLPAFNQAARAIGTVTVFEDFTHTVREMPMVLRYKDGLYAPLAVQLVAQYLGLNRGKLAYLGTDHTVRIGKKVFRLTENDGLYLNFRGPAKTFDTFAVIDFVNGHLPRDALKDRIVLLGITHLGHDTARTPFGRIFPGVELQATAVDNLLREDYITRASPMLDAVTCLALGLLISFLYWQRFSLPPWVQVAGSALVLLAYVGVSYFLFAVHNLWLSWIGPVGVCVVVSGVCLSLSYLGEQLQRRKLRHAFAHYLSDNVIEKLLAEPGALSLGGERRELSVLFSDIRNFTSLSERIAPEELVAMLNTYFTPMTRAVLANEGFLDKYVGDALMAVFGAPVPNPEHPDQALACSLRMHEELRALQPVLKASGIQIQIGVSVSTGEMIVGNMGSAERFDYTVVGDVVNLASRLEGLTKVYGVFCLVNDRTRKLARTEFSFREVDRVQVKGKSVAVGIHELVSGPGSTIETYRGLSAFEHALEAYRQGQFKEAQKAFSAFLEANPHDKVTKLYLNRLQQLGDSPPEGWNGVSVHLTK
jgi:adenylate cyclase